MRIVMVGAGGHARVCVEALADDPDHFVVGCVSRDGRAVADLGVEVLGTDARLAEVAERVGAMASFVAIGDSRDRARLAGACRAADLHLTVAISRHAVMSRHVTVGDGAAILPGATVNAATTIGEGAIVNTCASVDHDCTIGAFSHVAPGATLGGDVHVGDYVLVGIGSTVLPGVTIGDGAIIGAGAVVLDDVAPGATVIGVPARPREERP